MALTRKLLKSMGIEDEKIDQIIEAHTETVDALKAERDGMKDAAIELEEAKRELEALKNAPGDDYREKFEEEHKAFEEFKAQVEADKAHAEKADAYRKMLVEAGVDEKRLDSVMKVADLDALEIKDGEVKDRDKALEAIKADWADFITETKQKPAQVPTPPDSQGGKPEPHSLKEALAQHYER